MNLRRSEAAIIAVVLLPYVALLEGGLFLVVLLTAILHLFVQLTLCLLTGTVNFMPCVCTLKLLESFLYGAQSPASTSYMHYYRANTRIGSALASFLYPSSISLGGAEGVWT